ncbi:hemin uptake protein HemP [Thiocystis violacea]|uniref:hemin uptake protein HemP n=1 Tax=Thiocystis violacea TaxID=13725 RepID=UPI001902F035|nr:hemin uptake protein HemP [Thiocystis violacea]MBK1720895.1 hemin transporter [Thiocystis violacea]
MIANTAPTNRQLKIQSSDQSGQAQPRRIDSHSLMAGQPLLMIEHAGSHYYLRMTRNNKLILTK